MEKVSIFSEVLLFSNPNRKSSKTHSKLQIISKSIDFVDLEEFVKKLYKSNKDTGIYINCQSPLNCLLYIFVNLCNYQNYFLTEKIHFVNI